MDSVRLHPPRNQENEKSDTIRTDGFGYPGERTALCTPSKHPSGRNPDSAPRPMYPPVTRQSIYPPRVVARQPSVSSSTTRSALGFNFSARSDRVALVPKSERANRPWVIQAHQAATIAAIVHNRGREPVWRSISCGLVWPLGRVT